MASTIRVPVNETEKLGEITAQLVREGVVFHVVLNGDDWVIEFTGGF